MDIYLIWMICDCDGNRQLTKLNGFVSLDAGTVLSLSVSLFTHTHTHTHAHTQCHIPVPVYQFQVIEQRDTRC